MSRKKNTERISIGELLKEGAEFSQDKSFGKGDYQFKFNKPTFYRFMPIVKFILTGVKAARQESVSIRCMK